MTFTAKFNVKKINIFNGISEFDGSFNLYKGGALVDSWVVMSGKWGKGALEFGKYLILPITFLSDTPDHNSFKKEGRPWLCPLQPLFKTERTNLCIHPDGGIFGTLGCVGVEENDISLSAHLSTAFKIVQNIPFSVEEFKKTA